MENSMQLWQEAEKLQEVKQLFAPSLTEGEFKTFVGIGLATGLNPFLREIWAVKYGDRASIFIGRDGYRKSAQRSPDYDYHISDAIYSNDQFSVEDGIPKHEYNFQNDRGKLIGAYCVVKRKNSTKPNFTFVELKEYSTGKSLWVGKPATMIKKVAEAQALRMTFQEMFAGTYDESEEFEDKQAQKPKVQAVAQKTTVSNVKVVSKKITPEQEQEIYELFIKTINNEDPEIQQKTATATLKKMYKVDYVAQLTYQQASNLISKLQLRLSTKQKKAGSEDDGKEVDEQEAVEVLQKTFPGSTVVENKKWKQQKNEEN